MDNYSPTPFEKPRDADLVIPFYDNLEPTPINESPILVEVERIYCFDWLRFCESDYQALTEICEKLPGYLRSREITWWFGDHEEQQPFLSASREPPGLQVYGVLPLDDWLTWDAAFQAAAGNLPMRTLRRGSPDNSTRLTDGKRKPPFSAVRSLIFLAAQGVETLEFWKSVAGYVLAITIVPIAAVMMICFTSGKLRIIGGGLLVYSLILMAPLLLLLRSNLPKKAATRDWRLPLSFLLIAIPFLLALYQMSAMDNFNWVGVAFAAVPCWLLGFMGLFNWIHDVIWPSDGYEKEVTRSGR